MRSTHQRERVQRCWRRHPLARQHDHHQQHASVATPQPAGMAEPSSIPTARWRSPTPRSPIISALTGRLRRSSSAHSTPPVPSLKLTNTIIAGNQLVRLRAAFAAGTVSLTSGGHNLVQDGTCSPVAERSDRRRCQVRPARRQRRPDPDPRIVDRQPGHRRGGCSTMPRNRPARVARPQGSACDIGAYEARQPGRRGQRGSLPP